MKLFFLISFLFLLINCSFDDKTGIWENENQIIKKENKLFSDFKKISSTKDKFNKIVNLDEKYEFSETIPIKNQSWNDIYFASDNNYKNLAYTNNNKIVFTSKKITKYQTNDHILFNKKNLITSDIRGNIIVFSVSNNEVLLKFNFYKKKYKRISKFLNLAIENNVIYISDNLGFVYALNYENNKLLWAKNYKVPFKSNIKISNDKIILANQNNSLYFLDKKNGELLNSIPTEESKIIKKFKNNLALHKNNIIFLNTYGSLYSINANNMRINWFINLNQSSDINPSNLFLSNQLTVANNKIYVPTNKNFYIIDLFSGSTNLKKNFSSFLKPIVTDEVLYTLDNNLLVATNLLTGKIIFSNDITVEVSDYLKLNKQNTEFQNLILADNKIFVFLKNSYILKFKINGKLSSVTKLPKKLIQSLLLLIAP